MESKGRLYCGYAPRVLKRLSNRIDEEEVLFVGAKDGSLTVLRSENPSRNPQFKIERHLGRGADSPPGKAVRVLLDYQSDFLIVGRDDGGLELINWSKPATPSQPIYFSQSDGTKGEESIRYANWLDRAQTRLLVAYGQMGTRLLSLENPVHNEEDLRSALEQSTPLEKVQTIRVAAAIPDPEKPESPANSFLLIGENGSLWSWRVGHTPVEIDGWGATNSRPATFEDSTYIGPSPHGVYKDIRALVVTTDTGVFAIDLRKSSWDKAEESGTFPQPIRLALPGGRLFCTAATYTEYSEDAAKGPLGQLWLTNRAGESLLFENEPLGLGDDFNSWALRFRRSGRFQLDAQALTAVSWTAKDQVWLAKACRDDHVRVFAYSSSRGRISTKQRAEKNFLRLRCDPADGDIVKDRLCNLLAEKGLSPRPEAWSGYALLAEFFELLADDSSSIDDFFEYLSQPIADIPIALLVSAAAEESEAPRHLAAAVRLWSLCLLGIVNRHSSPREEWYLGIFRYLLDIRQAGGTMADENRRALEEAIERAVRFTRKWGLYGQVNEIRQNLVLPLKILEAQYRGANQKSQLDELTYYSLLLRRSYSEVAVDTSRKKEGDHAWAVKTLGLASGTLVAASWRRQGISISLLESQGRDFPELVRASLPKRLLPSISKKDTQGDRDRYAFSRDILLLPDPRKGNRFRLLMASRVSKDSDLIDDLRLFFLELVRDGVSKWRVGYGGSRRLSGTGAKRGSGSVYRFLDLGADAYGSHLVVVGLEGREGVGEVALIKISVVGGLTLLGALSLLEYGSTDVPGQVVSPDLRTLRNRVWSLAQVDRENSKGAPNVALLAGCDNGEIWYIKLERSGKLIRSHRIARLTSAVKSLHAVRVGGRLRVFAGAKDGTIVAFQDLCTDGVPVLATLWATVESDGICYLDRHHYKIGKDKFHLVFAMTRNGVCLAFDDRKRASDFDPGKVNPQRPPFPGIRWLRTSTDATSFAADSLVQLHGIDHSAWRLVATASGDGCIRIISLHYPRYSEARKDLFKRQCDRLWSVASDALVEGKKRSLADDFAFRVVEAAYRSAPLLPLIVVRMLLDPGIERLAKEEGWMPGLEGARPWCLPQNLRPVLDLRHRWDAALLQKDASGREIDEIGRALAAALDAAWAGQDIDLFQEICTLTLKRLNFQLFTSAASDATVLKAVYFMLFDVIRGRLQLWLGSSDRKDMRSRIVVGKNFLDGDTFYEIAERLEKDKGQRGIWREILFKRVEGVIELILVGNNLVSLEALRAANHSLVRFCLRLSEARKASSGRLQAIRWSFFQRYVSQLVHGAVQRLDTNLRLGDAMTQEYSRTFALCFYACPEGLLNISSDLVDARLIRDPRSEDDFTKNIEGQVDILSKVFGLAEIKALWDFVKKVHLHFSIEELPQSQDAGEWEDKKLSECKSLSRMDEAGKMRLIDHLWEYGDLYRFVSRLKNFAESLSTDAKELGLATPGGVEQMRRAIPGNRGVFPHSWAFWEAAIGRFPDLNRFPTRATERIRPETILFVERVIADWAKGCIKDLEQRYSNGLMFEPETGVFREVLGRVERAAREFPSSAAVQKNLVVGILGHHLLEDLDLHVLELREVARNLDPIEAVKSSGHTDKGERVEAETVAGQFASLLVRRSRRALSLPKNLRALSKVLEPTDEVGSTRKLLLSDLFHDSVWDRSKWGSVDFKIVSAREREYLALIVSELEQNHLVHSGFDDDCQAFMTLECSEGRLTIKCPVRRADTETRWKLVKEVSLALGQEPFKPNPLPGIPSTGVGLYLSCLAAAMVGWRILLSSQKETGADLAGWLIVELYSESATSQRTAASPIAANESAKAERSVRNVVVIDDKLEVAYYVWRELGQVTGFGSAEARETVSEDWSGPLVVPSGETRIWWIPAKLHWRDRLDRLFKSGMLEEASFFLVDVRGPVGEGSSGEYQFLDVLAAIKREKPSAFPAYVWLISSYEHGARIFEGSSIEIRSKSPETLRKLGESLGKKKADEPSLGRALKPRTAHVLVTGAGFEFRDEFDRQQLGIPPTRVLLKDWITRVYGAGQVLAGKNFPIPREMESFAELEKADEAGSLDNYWSYIIQREREKAGGDVIKFSAREYDLRRRFRLEFLRYDWGYLPQAMAAARFGWSAWVSTNYTRFANRAIEICGRDDWSTIEFGEEAQNLSNRMLGGAYKPGGESVLFKLHGDIGHVLTMALSKEDKTIETMRSSFMPLYIAAQTYLQELARNSRRVVWHIVGHGLKDELLVHLIEAAYQNNPKRHRFIVIAPGGGYRTHPVYQLWDKKVIKPSSIRGHYAKAGEYLSRLERKGLKFYKQLLREFEIVPDLQV